ncbi:MAG TPA: glycosyltransferase [Methanocella sp.]|nr:glycosyltransferase [Methanocella sp.]
MRVLFAYTTRPDVYDAYVHRVMSLKSGLEGCGVQTASLYLGYLPFRQPFLLAPINIPVVRRFLEGFDFIHAGHTGAAYLMGLARLTRRTGARIIYDVHADPAQEQRPGSRGVLGLKHRFNGLQDIAMEKLAAMRADYFAVCSESFRDRYLSLGVRGEQIDVVPDGANIEIFKPRSSPENDVFTITCAGQSLNSQGIDQLLEAARLLKDERVRFRVIGLDATARKSPEGQCVNVELTDLMPLTALVDHLGSADGLAIPGARHRAPGAFPGKFAEYIACGVPVIVTGTGDEGRLTRRHQCGLVCEDSAASLADAVLKLKSYSPEERKEMGENGRRLAEDLLDYRKISRNYYQFLKDASGN